MTTEAMTRDTVLEMLKGLPEGDARWVVESYIWGSSKAKSSRKRDPDAPKKEVTADSYFHLTNAVVWPVIKAYIERMTTAGMSEEALKELKNVRARTQVSSAIWATLKDLEPTARGEAIAEVSEDKILEALKAWRESPPETRYKSKDGASTTSGASKASSKKSKLSEMSEEERKAFYKARAAKAAATKAAKKAAAAGGAAAGGSSTEDVEVEEEDEEDEEAASVTPVECELEIDGKGLMKFGKVDYNGTTYVFKSDGSFLGAYNAEKKKVKKVENPFA